MQAYERGRIFQFAGAARKLYPLENKCKQAEQSRAEEKERQMGMVRKSGKDKETFAEWKIGKESLLPV